MGSLTATMPTDWKDLQREVASVLSECGFSVDSEKVVETARGKVELDVFAREEIDYRIYSIACECKYWKSAIPQTVVHSFRTVVADMGAHCGYIISKVGFQAGCYAAIANTNIKLLDWVQFQDEFKTTWLYKHLFPSIADNLDNLMTCTEPLVPTWFLKVPDSEVEVLKSLRAKYQGLGYLAMQFSPYARFGGRGYPTLPLRNTLNAAYFSEDVIPADVLDATGYRDLRDALMTHGLKAIEEFEIVRKRNLGAFTGKMLPE